ncbi:nucleoside deaminase [Candidatus Coxiella mudrowiae]|uniref:Cytidine/deoxycytidylate deaminase family protein n=1 Tax=Candidatus Coxiella mudrowiae TaxID=2054173 RepID=A0ABM5UV46_9COXI|nr:nucleoside deaminase [Candidatus Coxiella mudrowiae]AKQ33790.1 Cytidine/deoxycytidylate deaminase family protein [Candidatus Coxiella mudrowiae]
MLENTEDKKFMTLVFDLVKKAVLENYGGHFGSIIVKNSQIISEGTNQVNAINDPTAHGEIVAIRKAFKSLGTYYLSGCHLYTNCEPSTMCPSAYYWARIDKIFFSLEKTDADRIGFDDTYFYEKISKPFLLSTTYRWCNL